MRIAVSAGHHPDAQGASRWPRTEYQITAAMAGALVSALTIHGEKAYLVGSGPLKDKVDWINKLATTAAIEFHLNAGGGRGCETLYCPGSVTGKKLAECVQSGIVEATRFRDRGAKEGWHKMVIPPDPKSVPDFFLSGTRCPAIIVEPYFIDTESNKGTVFNDMIVAGIISGLRRFWQ